MPVDPRRTISDLEQLRALPRTSTERNALPGAPTWLKARAWFQSKLAELPVEHHYDAAGNSWTTLRGDSDRALILGSHLDSVPNGGWLDGCLGVLAGFEVLRSLAEDYNGKPPVTIRLVDWADEEGARFGRSLFGSSAFAGTHTIEADRGRTDRDGIRLEDALRAMRRRHRPHRRRGRGARQRRRLPRTAHRAGAGPRSACGLPLGVVLGTKGVERHAITFHGQEAHSGSTPMAVRRDALAAAAKLALEIRPIARKHPDAVCTMGSVKTFPGIVTAVVGRCETTLDMRDLDAGVLASMLAKPRKPASVSPRKKAAPSSGRGSGASSRSPFIPQLIELCDQAIRETAGTSHRLPSGPLHDAAEVARAGIPTVMMFTQSLAGLSHNPAEDTKARASGAGGPGLRPAGQKDHRLAGSTADVAIESRDLESRCFASHAMVHNRRLPISPSRVARTESTAAMLSVCETVYQISVSPLTTQRRYRPNERPNVFCRSRRRCIRKSAARFGDLHPPLRPAGRDSRSQSLPLLLRRTLHRGLPHAHRCPALHQEDRQRQPGWLGPHHPGRQHSGRQLRPRLPGRGACAKAPA